MKEIIKKEKKFYALYNIFLLFIFIFMIIGYYYFDYGKDNLINTKNINILEKKRNEHNLCKKCNNINFQSKELNEICKSKGYDTSPCTKQSKFDLFELSSYATSAQEFYESTITSNYSTYIIPFFIPFFVIFPSIMIITKEYNSKNIKNMLLRQSYNNYIKSIIKKAYKNIWVVPCLFIFLYVISFCITGNLDYRYMEGVSFAHHYGLLSNPLFYVNYLIVLLLNFAFYINVGMIISSKNKNMVITLVEVFLFIYFIWIFNEIVLSRVLDLFQLNSVYFNFLNIYTWEGISNMWLYTLFNFIPFLLSFIYVIINFKNKEKFIMFIEK